MVRWRTPAILVLLAISYTGAGMLFVPRLGIEVDEALVTNGIYEHGSPWYSWHWGRDEVPVMLNSYLGALKTWMYNAIFLLTPPRPIPLRLPTLLIGAGTLFVFFWIAGRAAGRVAAWIATALLATDTAYLLMNAVDYGPVTFQFALKLGAVGLMLRFVRESSAGEQPDRGVRRRPGGLPHTLAGAFFLLGVALWDKAIFSWVLCGLALGVVVVFPGELRKLWTITNLRIAVPAMLVGALPLVIYNVARPLETVRSNVAVEDAAILGKSVILSRTLDGSVFYGFMFAADSGPQPGAANHWYQSLSIAMGEVLGQPRQNLTLIALGGTLLVLPFLWRTSARRPVLFALAAGTATWAPMVLTAGAGAAAQHVILLWPWQFLAIGAALAQVRWRAVVIAATVLLCTANLAVTNQHYTDLIRNGPALRWTDAMDLLHRTLTDLKAPRVYVADWGIIETMNLLSEGELPMYAPDLSNAAGAKAALDFPGSIFVGHVSGQEFHPQERATLEEIAAREHFEREMITTIYDRNGRPAFDIFRFRKIHL